MSKRFTNIHGDDLQAEGGAEKFFGAPRAQFAGVSALTYCAVEAVQNGMVTPDAFWKAATFSLVINGFISMYDKMRPSLYKSLIQSENIVIDRNRKGSANTNDEAIMALQTRRDDSLCNIGVAPVLGTALSVAPAAVAALCVYDLAKAAYYEYGRRKLVKGDWLASREPPPKRREVAKETETQSAPERGFMPMPTSARKALQL